MVKHTLKFFVHKVKQRQTLNFQDFAFFCFLGSCVLPASTLSLIKQESDTDWIVSSRFDISTSFTISNTSSLVFTLPRGSVRTFAEEFAVESGRMYYFPLKTMMMIIKISVTFEAAMRAGFVYFLYL